MSSSPDKEGQKGPRGVLLVVSSPSGAGKTTLSRMLQEEFPNLGFSVSYTTRPPRPGEKDGVDYHFIDDPAFDRMVEEKRFVEWANIHGYRYGTAFEAIDQALEQGRDMIFDVDYQGGRGLRASFTDAVMVFVLPPSIKVLEERLKRRATESKDNINRRLNRAAQELTHYDGYSFLVVNEELKQAYDELRSIYQAARCTSDRRSKVALELIIQAQQRLENR